MMITAMEMMMTIIIIVVTVIIIIITAMATVYGGDTDRELPMPRAFLQGWFSFVKMLCK